jgi:transposase-like protein
MTTQEKLIRRKQSLLELGEYLHNISQACKIHGVSRQHFYDIRKAYEEYGLEGSGRRAVGSHVLRTA